ncbi:ATP-binding protein [Sphaerisporangium aureirubrum]|uniref:ATP-binding protein n=1 Tax=Sphaerisporangium aureirubrum TaxID=1544736 RepID=A0ABW1NCF2_9ACTN
MHPIPFRATLIGELELPRLPRSPGDARSAVDEWLGADHPAGFDVRLVVSELVTNAVRHSDVPAPDGVRLRLYDLAGLIRVEVRDPGAIRTSPVVEASCGGAEDSSREGGRGLFIVERCSARWGVEYLSGSLGCVVWCEISTPEGSHLADVGHELPGEIGHNQRALP